MCGITGQLALNRPICEADIRPMLAAIRHRGPDQFGIYIDQGVGLGNARLSIIDLSTGQQPICNEDGTLWIVYNGEVFNYRELRADLVRSGHRFTTETDTEVVLHLYEQFGPACLNRLNGQFAMAIWDANKQTLFLARDRLGVRPLFYAQRGSTLFFASEIKAILAGGAEAELDPVSLDQIFTFWSPLSPHSVFRGIHEVPPGSYMLSRNGSIELHKYWELNFPDEAANGSFTKSTEDYLAEFRQLLIEATAVRLRADVPVGAYLSGGLDSSLLAAIIRKHSGANLDTFSIAFSDPRFDESQHQMRMAKFLGTAHQVVYATHADIGQVFPEVIWHTEVPLLRTSPAPMFLLSRLVHDRQYKVVLTGEGADEFFGGYDIFKEAKIRRFWARQPGSQRRPTLFKKLYADIARFSQSSDSILSAFFGDGLTDVDNPGYSHAIRWKNTRRAHRFFSDNFQQLVKRELGDNGHTVDYPAEFMRWGPLQRAQYLESSIFLSQYLLSSQGDRMGMAHSVEGRFPFLDHRIVEFAAGLPASLKLRGLTEKYLVRQLGRELLPPEICARVKRAYRAPIHRSFFNERTQDYVRELLSAESIRSTGIFNPAGVHSLVQKIDRGVGLSETDDMALTGILSTQLVHHQFMRRYSAPSPLSSEDDVRVCFQKTHRKEITNAI